MVLTIARAEFRSILRDGRFRTAAALLLTLTVGVVLAERARTDSLRTERAEAQQLTHDQWLSQGDKNPHSAAHFGLFAFAPLQVLAAFDPGVQSHVGTTVWLEAPKRNEAKGRPAEDAGSLARLGELSPAGVLQWMTPLLIILLTFAAYAGERESGTLRLVLSTGVRWQALAVGKVLGASAALALLLVPLGALTLLLLGLGGAQLTQDALLRSLAIIGGYALYVAVWLFTGVGVSALASTRRSALVILLCVWGLTVLVAPRLISLTARTLHPAPTSEAFAAQVEKGLKEGLNGHDPANARTLALERETLARYGLKKKEDLPVNFAGIALQAGEEHGNRVYDASYHRLWRTHEAQERSHAYLSLVSPLQAIQRVSAAMAGTDFAHHRHFAQAAEVHRRELVARMNNTLAAKSRTGDEYKAGRELWGQVQGFAYAHPSVRWSLVNAWSGYAALGLWFTCSLLLVLFAAAKASPLVKV